MALYCITYFYLPFLLFFYSFSVQILLFFPLIAKVNLGDNGVEAGVGVGVGVEEILSEVHDLIRP